MEKHSCLENVITAKEVSKNYGIPIRTVRDRCERGFYECRKAFGIWLILLESINEKEEN